jgi:alpha-tubulin suppressor-like RCC1 family protein
MPREMTRRTALALLSSVPAAAHAVMQTTPARPRRVVFDGNRGLLRETDGTALGWRIGLGFRGQAFGLGHNDDLPPYVGLPIPGLRDVAEMALIGGGGFARLEDGRVLGWGVNSRGGVGNTPLAEFEAGAAPRGAALSPTPILHVTDAVGISSGGDHALAVTRSGAVYAWGFNMNYQLGIGDWPVVTYKTRSAQPTNFMPYPVPIPGLSDVAAVAAGSQHSLALLKDGTVRSWGSNVRGQLGDGTTTNRRSPVAVLGIKNAVAVAASVWISAALLADGTVMTWGYGNAGLGRPGTKPDAAHPTPALVAGVSGIRSISLAEAHVLALTSTGTVVSWGDDTHGRRGHRRSVPSEIAGLKGVQSVAAGGASSFAVDAGGTITTWGMVPLWARVDGDDASLSRTPIPLVLKGLKNP